MVGETVVQNKWIGDKLETHPQTQHCLKGESGVRHMGYEMVTDYLDSNGCNSG